MALAPVVRLWHQGAMTAPRFFGFGSLVNTRTHAYPGATPATLHGWERVWVQEGARGVTFLSARPAPGRAIDGLVCEVPGGDWAALDAREAGYDRRDITAELGLPGPVALYWTPALAPAADPARPILLSYLDVVVQGFEARFGTSGVARFFDTTTGWNVPLLDDRTAPRYPRAQRLEPTTSALTDGHVARLGLTVTR